MSLSKKKNWLNLFFSSGSQVILLALGLIVPRIILTHYGSDTNGLTGTITNVFTCLALLEAGISIAARNALYKPIKENNKEGISYVMSMAKRYYSDITYFYAALVIVLAFILPVLIKTKVSYWTVFFVILFEGMTNVVSFYFICTWSCIITASGKSYVNDGFQFLQKFLCYIVKIVLALFSANIGIIQACFFVVSLINLYIYYTYMKLNYGWLDYKAAPRSAKLPDRKSYIVSEVAWAIFSSADMIILSVFMSTTISSIYSVYNMVFAALNRLMNSVYNAFRYKLGQKYHGDRLSFISLYDTYNSLFLGGMTTLICVANILMIPFIGLYTNGVEDTNYINPFLPILFSLVQIISWSRTVSGDIIGISGRQRKAVIINLIEMLTNVILSLIFVKKFGLVGVLLATVIALPLKVVYCTYITEKIILKRKPWKTLLILGVNYLFFVSTIIIKKYINFDIKSYLSFFYYGLVLTMSCGIVVIILNSIVNKDFRGMILGRLRLSIKKESY